MDLTIVSEKDNPLFSRKEVTAQVKGFTASPSRTDVLALLASHLKTDAANIHIDEIQSPYGGVFAIVSASIYQDAKSHDKYTTQKQKERGIKKEAKKK